MFTSKGFHFSSAALVTLFGSLAAFHWGDFVDAKTAAEIVAGIGAAKAIISVFAPATVPAPTA